MTCESSFQTCRELNALAEDEWLADALRLRPGLRTPRTQRIGSAVAVEGGRRRAGALRLRYARAEAFHPQRHDPGTGGSKRRSALPLPPVRFEFDAAFRRAHRAHARRDGGARSAAELAGGLRHRFVEYAAAARGHLLPACRPGITSKARFSPRPWPTMPARCAWCWRRPMSACRTACRRRSVEKA